MSNFRNKENKLLLPGSRARSSIPSLVKSPEKVEFFTNSVLDVNDASQTSLIPSPSPLKTSRTKPRRKIATQKPLSLLTSQTLPSQKPSHDEGNGQYRRSQALSVDHGSSPHVPLATPQRSRDSLDLMSPASTLSSPPRALTDTYQRIEQEEDLAATEGEVWDPEYASFDDNSESATARSEQGLPKKRLFGGPASIATTSRGGTPTQDRSIFEKEKTASDHMEVMSEPTGMSFLEQLSDRNLAAKLTPMTLESARDRAALERAWSKQKPVAFGKARGMRRDAALSASHNSSPTLPTTQLYAFGRREKPRRASEVIAQHHHRSNSDTSPHFPQALLEEPSKRHADIWHDEDGLLPSMPLNPRSQRLYFSRTHGFPMHEDAQTAGAFTNAAVGNVDENRSASAINGEHGARSLNSGGIKDLEHSADSIREPPLNVPRSWFSNRNGDKFAIEESDHEEGAGGESDMSTQQSSEVNWAQAAADVPLPSVEGSSLTRSRSSPVTHIEASESPEKSRRWDNDFTGQSFQVSDSPPVRSKPQARDLYRDREIAGISKQARVTSRLSEIRERGSQEQLRRASRSPSPFVSQRETKNTSREPSERLSLSDNKKEDLGFSSANIRSLSQNWDNPDAASAERPHMDQTKSHDYLQRLARGLSTTPRSSPPPGSDSSVKSVPVRPTRVGSADEAKPLENGIKGDVATMSSSRSASPAAGIPTAAVAETPRVAGAWTDTILPDTVKTVKQAQRAPVYAQTPHVGAGGWIDTPKPSDIKHSLTSIQEDAHEIPEELTDGIVKNVSEKAKLASDVKEEDGKQGHQIAEVPQTMAQKVLSEAKDKLKTSSKNGTSSINDTLNLGNATIQSLEEILNMDETELTTLSRLGDDTLQQLDMTQSAMTEAAVLERLGVKLDRLCNSIHDAKKGISKLEHQVTHSQTPNELQPASTSVVKEEDKVQPADPPPQAAFPSALLTFSIPVPLLFRPRRLDLGHRFPRPTLLGCATFLVWTWYLVECTMCELYSHPLYAEKYSWPKEPEPEFPFVLPTMLGRWLRVGPLVRLVFWPVWRLLMAVLRGIAMSIGLRDGFVDDLSSPLSSTATVTALKAATTFVTGGEPDLSLMNDEFL